MIYKTVFVMLKKRVHLQLNKIPQLYLKSFSSLTESPVLRLPTFFVTGIMLTTNVLTKSDIAAICLLEIYIRKDLKVIPSISPKLESVNNKTYEINTKAKIRFTWA